MMDSDTSTILVLAAHPDDEVLGCGGTIARHAREGHKIHIRILGEGVTSRYDEPDKAPQSELDALHADSEKVAEILGAASHEILGLPDNRFDTVPLLDLVKEVEAIIESVEPEVVLTQHGGDLNVDHQRTFRATLTATRPTGDSPLDEVYAYEVGSSTEWAFDSFAPSFEPDTFVGVSETLERRIDALSIYDSETREFPHPRSPEAQRAIAKRWGSVAGVEAAEAFKTVRRKI